LDLDAAATGASGVSMAIAGRLRQLASEVRDDRAAVNGGNVRYHGGSAAAAAGTVAVLPASLRRPSEDWTVVSPTCWLTNVLADREADL